MINQTIITSEDLEKLKFDPIKIGEKVLQALGYTVSSLGFGYSSLEIKVKNSDDEEVFKRVIGE